MLIAGPTASGKSTAALRLAEEAARHSRAAWIVNADSMQVYEGLRVLTARPDEAEEAHVPHRLYGHVPPEMRYSAGAWLRDMKDVLAAAHAADALPIVVGGTGLYLKALTEGLAAVPAVPEAVQRRWSDRLADEGAARLHALLAERDPESAAAIRPADAQRIQRALGVLEATGIPLAEWRRTHNAAPLIRIEDAARFVIEPDRAVLYGRIGERVDRMIAGGAVEEVRRLLARGLDESLPAMKAIGVATFAAHLRGEVSLAEAAGRTAQESRRYAKRQLTWFRHQMPGWRSVTA